jgi:Flp pilus assembly protein TadG
MRTRHVNDDRGAAAIFLILMTVALLIAAGLVIDGGYALAERRQLTNQAEQAARVGADALDQASLRDGGTPRVDPAAARTAATAYLTRVGATGATVTIDGAVVEVQISGHTDTTILSIVGIGTIPVTGTAAARSIDEDTP